MNPQAVILLAVFCIYAESYKLDDKFSKLIDAKWQCNTICAGSGGDVEYFPETNICKCTLGNNIDDVAFELMLKNANLLGINLTIEPSTEAKNIIKRDTTAEEQSAAVPIVGQSAPIKTKPTPTSRNRLFNRSTTTTKKPSKWSARNSSTSKTAHQKPTANPNHQRRMQELQTRLSELRQNRDHQKPNRPQLQPKSSLSNERQTSLIDQIRERQQQRRQRGTVAPPRVGAVHEEEVVSSTTPAAGAGATVAHKIVGSSLNKLGEGKQTAGLLHGKDVVGEKKPEIITQDPSLIDGDN